MELYWPHTGLLRAFRHRNRFAGRRLRAAAAGTLLVVEYFVTLGTATQLGVEAYRPLGVALFAVLVLSGPVNPYVRPRP